MSTCENGVEFRQCFRSVRIYSELDPIKVIPDPYPDLGTIPKQVKQKNKQFFNVYNRIEQGLMLF